MKSRLVITFSAGRIPREQMAPFVPALLIEDGAVGLFTTDWVAVFENAVLENLTERDIREWQHIQSDVEVYLTEVRETPDDNLFSEVVTVWRQQWWQEALETLRQERLVGSAA